MIELLFAEYLLLKNELIEPVYTEEVLLSENEEEEMIKHIEDIKLKLRRISRAITDIMRREGEELGL